MSHLGLALRDAIAGTHVFGGVSLELRLAGRTAEQELFVAPREPMGCVGSNSHSTHRISQISLV
jgi:hypothetical protein